MRLLVGCVLLQKVSNALLLSRALDGPCIWVMISIAIPAARHTPVQDMYVHAANCSRLEMKGGQKLLTYRHGREALR